MNAEQFEKVTSSIKNIIIGFAVVIGGWWSYFTFGGLREMELANAELEQTERSLTQVALNIDVQVRQVNATNPLRYGLWMKVLMTNLGSVPINLDLRDHPLVLSKIRVAPSDSLFASKCYMPYSYTEIRTDRNQVAVAQQIQPRTTKVVEFYQEVEDPGLFYISFRSFADSYVAKLVRKNEIGVTQFELTEDGDFDDRTAWRASTFFEVRETDEGSSHP